jgi:hypothetical protein
MYRTRMHSYQDTAFAVLDKYDILYGGHKTDAGVGSGRRRRFLDVDFASPRRQKRVRNRTERISCVFGVIEGYRV